MLNVYGKNKLITMSPTEQHINQMNTTSENMTYLVDNFFCLCQHNKLHRLTAKRGKCISETMYIDIDKIIQHDSQKYITSEGGDDLSNQKWTNSEIEYDQFCCSDCTNSSCLNIKKKMSVLEKLYNLVRTLTINDYNE